ncbi:MAG TPA: carbohydrate binding domain-containing protein [Chthoniobacteraceae bacterium]|jgi:hypothetical protein|nr:carbohydrate binding domain-containing protein [Chthoniobacteraceae bacterium]
MNRSLSILVGALSIAIAPALCAAADLFPFVLPWDDATPGITNISNLLEKPAGLHGFVTAKDGHLFAGDQRIRFFGVNMAFGGDFPTHADAEKVAARMAKFGINCVRFHHMDTGTAPGGLLQKDRKTLDPESLDRLDYFVNELKKNGIYTNLNLHVGNQYAGMPAYEGSGYFKGVDNFFPAMIEQQHAYATALLKHVNPYTKLAYTADPAVAFIEINNENGLIMEWNGKALDAMPDPYAAEFSKQWNEWLKKKYGTPEKLAAAWSQGEERLGAELLANHDFRAGADHWFLEQHEGAKAAMTFGGSNATTEMALNVTAPGKEGWHVQFSQSPVKVEKGKSYTISFRARAPQPAKINVGLSQAHAPWKGLGTQEVKLTTEYQDLSFVVTPSDSDDQARLSFSNLGLQLGEYHFHNVSLRSGGSLGLLEGEALGKVAFIKRARLAQRTLAAQKDWQRFLFDEEAAYWPGMSKFLKGELGAKSLVLGSATGFSPWPVQAMLDVVDAHAYWQHPHFPGRQWDMNNWTVKNESMAGREDGGTLPGLALRRVAGKPFIVTEYNHASPNTYSSEAFLEVMAVAALQDWDGVFAFAYSHRLNDWDTKRLTSFFDIDQHPGKMATLPAALTLFYRTHLIPPSAHVVSITQEQAIDSVAKGGSWVDGKAYGLKPEETFAHPVAFRIAPKPSSTLDISALAPQLKWDTKAHRMTVTTPRSECVVGNMEPGETIDGGAVRITAGVTRQKWAAISATVMKGDSFFHAQSILVTAVGDTENADLQWKNAEKTSVSTWGKGPSTVEGIAATLTFPGGAKWKAWSLDERGHHQTEVPLQHAGGETKLTLSPEQKTLWWEIAEE